MYISASSDPVDLLSNIFVYDQGNKISLNELKNNKVSSTSGEYKLYIVQKSAYVRTALTTDQMKTLTGVMYISNPNQAKDANFHVIDIDKPQTFTFQDLGDISLTYLFLNTHMDTNPTSSSVISQWKQSKDARNFIYPGFPTRSIETKNTQIFSNPMYTTNFDGYFENVESFSLTMQAFYLRSYRGFGFKIEPGYWNINGTTTSSYNTTGFYVKPSSTNNDGPITISTKKEKIYSGYTGANIIGSLSTGAQVTFAEYGGPYDDQISIPPNNFIVPWSTPNIGTSLTISSTVGSTGQYYVQYFVLQCPGNCGITPKPGSSTSSPVETTTKSSGTIQILISLMTSIIVFIGFY